jgi:hypothetical protein
MTRDENSSNAWVCLKRHATECWTNLGEKRGLQALLIVTFSVLVWIFVRHPLDPDSTSVLSKKAWVAVVDSACALLVVTGFVRFFIFKQDEKAIKTLLEDQLTSQKYITLLKELLENAHSSETHVTLLKNLLENALGSRDYLNSLSLTSTQETTRQLLESTVGNSLASSIAKTFIAPNAKVLPKELKKCFRYRSQIHYKEETFAIVYGNEARYTLQPDMYYSLTTQVDYEVAASSRWQDMSYVELVFCLNDSQLNYACGMPMCIFREEVKLSSQDHEALLALLAENNTSPFTVLECGTLGETCFTSSCVINGISCPRKGIRYDPEAGICIQYSYPKADAATVTFKLSVQLPYFRLNPIYPVIFLVPTEVDSITLRLLNVRSPYLVGCPMLTLAERGKVTIAEATISDSQKEIEVSVGKQVVYPTSGVTFSWHDTGIPTHVTKKRTAGTPEV